MKIEIRVIVISKIEGSFFIFYQTQLSQLSILAKFFAGKGPSKDQDGSVLLNFGESQSCP